jgi:hypothetical protein
MAGLKGNIVERIAIILLVAEDVPAPWQSGDQTRSYLGFPNVQRRDFPL